MLNRYSTNDQRPTLTDNRQKPKVKRQTSKVNQLTINP